jgi:tetratricopeptide (TPR) repeat protein
LRAARTALDYAERAVRLNPRNSDAHLSVAIVLGKMTQFLGNRESIEASKRIKAEAEEAARLDPQSDYAWHLLGRWHQALAGMGTLTRGLAKMIYGEFPPATNEDAVRCFTKAIAINPSRLVHHVELGRTYAQMGHIAEARAAIAKGLAMPDREKHDAETKKRGREALAKLR